MMHSRNPWNTGIDVNTSSDKEHAYIYLASSYTSSGDDTLFEFGIIRLGYSGNHATKTVINKSGTSEVINISVTDGKLIITPVIDTITLVSLRK